MLVETFEVLEESPLGAPECDAAAIALIEELELDGQRELVVQDDKTGDLARIPYRLMTDDEATVYGTLLMKEKAERYNSGPVPLRVLQVMAHAKSLGCFKHFHIWHAKDTTVKDPILTATMEGEYSSKHYLLARWGEELEPLSVLMDRAAVMFRANAEGDEARYASEHANKLSAIQSLTLTGRGLIAAVQKIQRGY